MFAKFIHWIMLFYFNKKAKQLLMLYEEVNNNQDKTEWMKSFFTIQETFIKGKALDGIFINKFQPSLVFIYGGIDETKAELKKFQMQMESNGAINVSALQEFTSNASSQSLHQVFNNDIPVKDQLIELNDILKKIMLAYDQQTPSFKSMNLSRMVPLFEMYSIIVNRITVAYINSN